MRVTVEFDGGQALTLATTEVQAFAGASDRNGVRALWIEVHAASSATVVIEELSAEFLHRLGECLISSEPGFACAYRTGTQATAFREWNPECSWLT